MQAMARATAGFFGYVQGISRRVAGAVAHAASCNAVSVAKASGLLSVAEAVVHAAATCNPSRRCNARA